MSRKQERAGSGRGAWMGGVGRERYGFAAWLARDVPPKTNFKVAATGVRYPRKNAPIAPATCAVSSSEISGNIGSDRIRGARASVTGKLPSLYPSSR